MRRKNALLSVTRLASLRRSMRLGSVRSACPGIQSKRHFHHPRQNREFCRGHVLCAPQCKAAILADVEKQMLVHFGEMHHAPAAFHFSCCAQASSNRAAISSSISFFASSRYRFAVLMLTIAAMR